MVAKFSGLKHSRITTITKVLVKSPDWYYMIAAGTILEKMVSSKAGRSVFPKTAKLHTVKEPFHLLIFLLYFISRDLLGVLIFRKIYCLFYLLKFACS